MTAIRLKFSEEELGMSESVNEFKSFYDKVKKWTVRDFRTQKIKAEVIVDMLISDYIEDIVSQSLGNDIKDIKLIAKEFPIARIGQTPNEKEGNRQYATVGAGFKMSVFTIDAAYCIATAQGNPLDQTMRFSLGFDLDGMKDLFGKRR